MTVLKSTPLASHERLSLRMMSVVFGNLARGVFVPVSACERLTPCTTYCRTTIPLICGSQPLR